MKIFIAIIILVLLAVFLPIYNGEIHCGINPDMPCVSEKLNLIGYLEYESQSGAELIKECPDELILNKMPRTGYSNTPPSYYIVGGVRKEIREYDQEWLRSNCVIPIQEVY